MTDGERKFWDLAQEFFGYEHEEPPPYWLRMRGPLVWERLWYYAGWVLLMMSLLALLLVGLVITPFVATGGSRDGCWY